MDARPTFSRPLHRRVIKIAALALGPKWSHGHSWLPFLRLQRDAGEEPRQILFKGRTVGHLFRVDALRDRLDGPSIHIVGSGPSILQTDLSQIGARSALLLNGALTLIGSPIDDPLALAVEDERFIWRHFGGLKAKVSPDVICLFSVGVIRAICEIDSAWLAGRRIILIDDIRKPYAAPKPDLDEIKARTYVIVGRNADAGFSLEPDRGVFQGGSVLVSALQFAIHCRPRSIGLFGIDISNADQPRFYEQYGNTAPSGLKRAEARIMSHLALARSVCTFNNTDLVNHSPVSLLNRHGFDYDNRFETKMSAAC